MRRTLSKGSFIKVTNADEKYSENLEMAEKLGADKAKLNIATPRNGQTGEVIGVEDGFILVDFGDFQYLMDIEGIEVTKKPEEIKYLVRYMHNNTLEEWTTPEEIDKRMKELVKLGHLRMDQEVKVYQTTGVKTVKMQMNVVLE